MTIQRIALVNAKGGSGKSTIATNLSVFFSSARRRTVLMDFDPQGSSSHWHAQRSPQYSPIHLINTSHLQSRQTRAFQMALPPGSECLVIDTPAGIQGGLLQSILDRSDTLLVPVVPSPIDVRATAAFLTQLGKEPAIRRGRVRVAVIANRVSPDCRAYPALLEMLKEHGLPLVAELHESRTYQEAAETGLGIHDDSALSVARERQDWLGLARWLALPDETPITPAGSHAVKPPDQDAGRPWRLANIR